MLYKIKFISDEVDGFLREIKIDSDATFLDLNKIILESCGYPDDQMTSFYICDEEWKRKEQITREDMGTGEADEDIYVMEETVLSDFIEDEDQKMEFVFDPFSERVFYLDVREIIPGENLKTPQIVRVKGDAPAQILDLDYSIPTVSAVGASALDEDEVGEFYGNDSFDNEEFDIEGFEISDGDSYN
ncbi:MAG: hypothetical protein IKB97_06800 [Bacteroidaceae bacterium]|nr:hypothetical protein [Bacteroidaceae bacterium]MBR2863248.1 hypothetical protein [Bacteroidaceae bacterium]